MHHDRTDLDILIRRCSAVPFSEHVFAVTYRWHRFLNLPYRRINLFCRPQINSKRQRIRIGVTAERILFTSNTRFYATSGKRDCKSDLQTSGTESMVRPSFCG